MSKDPVLVSRDQRPQKVHTAQQEYKRVPERDSDNPQDSDRSNKKKRVNVTRTTQEVVKCITKVTYDSVTKVTLNSNQSNTDETRVNTTTMTVTRVMNVTRPPTIM